MAAMTMQDPSLGLQVKKEHQKDKVNNIVEEIDGLIRVYKDGYVERPQIIPTVHSTVAPDPCVTSRDVIIDKCNNIWARFYIPQFHLNMMMPLIVYFHGGGFCVGSTSWICYHEFLAKLAANSNCIIMSVDYRLAPENPLPAAYDDGFKALLWVKQNALTGGNEWFSSKCNFASIFLAGDSAGGNIAYNIISSGQFKLSSSFKPLNFKGKILMQPFFGGESRTHSEKYMVQSPSSALTVAASDTYWRLSLPKGCNRDHPWCNPTAKSCPKLENLQLLPILICISEMDILKDRNLEFFSGLISAGHKVECTMYKGVGHAFQILNKSHISQERTQELICHIKNFIFRLK